MYIVRSICTVILLFFACMLSQAMAGPVSQQELETLFSGNTAFGKHLGKNLTLRDYYAKDGGFVSWRGKNSILRGKWWIAKNRSAICIRYKHKPDKPYCRGIIKNNDGSYSRIRASDGKPLIRYSRFEKGDKTK